MNLVGKDVCVLVAQVSRQLITNCVCANLLNKCSSQCCVLFRVQQHTILHYRRYGNGMRTDYIFYYIITAPRKEILARENIIGVVFGRT